VLLSAFAITLLCAVPPASAAVHRTLVWATDLNGRAVSTATAQHPLTVPPNSSPSVSLHLRNLRPRQVLVRSVRLESQVLGLSFLNSEARIDMAVGPGRAVSRTFPVDLFGLREQATGLLPARIVLLDSGGRVVASQSFALRVHGSWWSVYGRFGFAVAALTLVLLAAALWELVRGRQPGGRWRRGITLALPGVGLGFVLVFVLSASGLLLPSPVCCAVFLGAGGVLGFVAGLLTPNPYRGGHQAATPALDWQRSASARQEQVQG
jgi:hypothetical protein